MRYQNSGVEIELTLTEKRMKGMCLRVLEAAQSKSDVIQMLQFMLYTCAQRLHNCVSRVYDKKIQH